jgi:hypothetical protein
MTADANKGDASPQQPVGENKQIFENRELVGR